MLLQKTDKMPATMPVPPKTPTSIGFMIQLSFSVAERH